MNDFYNVMYMIIHAFDIVIMYKRLVFFLGLNRNQKHLRHCHIYYIILPPG